MTSPAGLKTLVTNPPGGLGPQPVRSRPAAAHQYRYPCTRAEVERVLPAFDAAPLSARDVHALIGVNVHTTVRKVLLEMEREGVAVSQIAPFNRHPFALKLYRRAPPTMPVQASDDDFEDSPNVYGDADGVADYSDKR